MLCSSVVEADVAQEGLLQLLAAVEMVALQHVLDPAVEPLDHAVGRRPHGRGEAMLDAEVCTEAVEGVAAGGGAPAQAEQPVGELLAVVGQHLGDLHRRRTLKGVIGDAIFAVLCGCGHNIRKILAHLRGLLALMMAALVTALRPQEQRCNRLAVA